MSKISRINELLAYADNQQRTISNDLGNYLNQEIPISIEIQVKNYLENLRSVLDYLAADVCENVLNLGVKHRTYFPMCFENEKIFVNHCKKYFPKLSEVDSELYSTFENIQQYKTDKFILLKTLTKLVNHNKHRTISKQNRKIENYSFSRFKVVRPSECKTTEFNSKEFDGLIIADETGEDEFLGSKFILENLGNVIELKGQNPDYITFEFAETGLNVIATLINLYNTVSDIIQCFESPLYQRYSI